MTYLKFDKPVSGTFSGSFSGNLTVQSASYSLTASFAANGGSSGVSSSYALTSSFAAFSTTASYVEGAIEFPLGVTASFSGSLTGSATFAISSSFSTTASYIEGAIDFPGGITGSFSGSLIGSASYALTSSYAVNSVSTIQSASYNIMTNLIPDTSSQCWIEPINILSPTTLFNLKTIRFGSASSTRTAVIHGIYGSFIVPDDYFSGSTIKISWNSPITSNNCIFELQYAIISQSNQSVVTAAPVQTIIITGSASAPAHGYRNSTFVLNNMVAGSHINYYLYRNGTAAADTLAGPVLISNIIFTYVRG